MPLLRAVTRLVLSGGLIYWVWTGSRIALVIVLALIVIAIEVINLTTPVIRTDRVRP